MYQFVDLRIYIFWIEKTDNIVRLVTLLTSFETTQTSFNSHNLESLMVII